MTQMKTFSNRILLSPGKKPPQTTTKLPIYLWRLKLKKRDSRLFFPKTRLTLPRRLPERHSGRLPAARQLISEWNKFGVSSCIHSLYQGHIKIIRTYVTEIKTNMNSKKAFYNCHSLDSQIILLYIQFQHTYNKKIITGFQYSVSFSPHLQNTN